MPRVTIHYNSTLRSAYEQILENLDRRFMPGPHNYYPELTPAEQAQQTQYNAYGEHPGRLPGNVNPERIVK